DGGVVVTGLIRSATDFGGGTLNPAGQADIFIARFDANGTHAWSHGFGGSASESGNGVDVDQAGAVVMAGDFPTPTHFGGDSLTSAGASDVFVAKFEDPQPVPVLITGFGASPHGSAVEIHWQVRSDESVKEMTLYRTDGDGTPAALASWTHVNPEVYLDS